MGGKVITILLFVFLINISLSISEKVEKADLSKANKKARQFSLFTIVTFPNDQCSTASGSSTGATKGTCLSTTECSSKSGTVDGNCASGFGVCCAFSVSACGSSVTENCTYVQNPSYSSSYTVTTTTSCTYTVTPLSSEICQMRLDFDTFVTVEATDVCTDSFEIVGPTDTNGLSNLCGKLTGQHVYVESGRSTSNTQLKFTIATTTGVTWNMKVSQIPCSATYKAPTDCAAYYTGASGFLSSFGHLSAAQLQSHSFSYCIRREAGYCSIGYNQVNGATIDAFELSDDADTVFSVAAGSGGLIIVPHLQAPNTALTGGEFSYNIAGGISTQLYATGPRFIITHVTETATDNSGINTGFNLQYFQIPCSSMPDY